MIIDNRFYPIADQSYFPGCSLRGKGTGDIIHVTGRFQGVKGTMTTSVKLLPPEKGELGGELKS
jgi:hypothetical protein